MLMSKSIFLGGEFLCDIRTGFIQSPHPRQPSARSVAPNLPCRPLPVQSKLPSTLFASAPLNDQSLTGARLQSKAGRPTDSGLEESKIVKFLFDLP